MMTTTKISRLRVRLYLTVTVLLLYETIGVVNTIPLVVSGGAAPQSSAVLQNHENIKLLSMPIWARKAGGNWRPELFERLSSVGVENPDFAIGDIGSILETGTLDVESEVEKRANDETVSVSVANHREQIDKEKKKHSTEKGESDQEKDDYEYEYDELIPEEQECPEDKFWHIRGLKCVPYNCPGGNTWRDRDTGDCILKHYGYRNRWKTRPLRPYHQTRRTFFGGGRGSRVLLFG